MVLHPSNSARKEENGSMPVVSIVFVFFVVLIKQFSSDSHKGYMLQPHIVEFLDFCEQKARWTLSHPQIVAKGKDGSLIDDYRQLNGNPLGDEHFPNLVWLT